MVRARRKGQGLVEFSMVVPLLLMFLAAIIDVGRFIHVQLVLEQLTADATRYAVVKDEATGTYPSSEQITARLDAEYPSLYRPYNCRINTSETVGTSQAVTCELSTSMRPFLLHLVGATGEGVTLSAAASHPRR
jgi:Flp pilus assembly protein TadG